jgi:hypothetical protein
MEIQQLSVTVQREIQARLQVEEELKQTKADMIVKIESVSFFFSFKKFLFLNREINRLKEENELIRKQLADAQTIPRTYTTAISGC